MISSENLLVPIQSSFLALHPSMSLDLAIATMADAGMNFAIAIEDGKLLGIFTERDIVRIVSKAIEQKTLTVADIMTEEVITLKISETKDVFALSRLFSRHKIRHLPILDEKDCVAGIITLETIQNSLKPEYLLRYIRAEEVMNENVITASPNDPILVSARLMTIHSISCVVVTDDRSKFPVGIITERDIVGSYRLGLDLTRTVVREVMSTPILTACRQDSLWNVHKRMQDSYVRRLAIVNSTGELAGIITQTQVLKILDPREMYHVMEQMREVIDRQTCELQELNRQLANANAELAHLSTVDELTQVVNRRQLNDFLDREWQRLSLAGKPLSTIMCDVDCFKAYNDTYGHLVGDECLVKIAKVLREVTRQTSDLVARYGGEEFVIVLPNTGKAGAESVAKKILDRIRQLQIPHVASTVADCVTVSLGVVTIIPDRYISPVVILQNADRLLYRSKDRGRNTYSIELIKLDTKDTLRS